jgi:hypothetical protein
MNHEDLTLYFALGVSILNILAIPWILDLLKVERGKRREFMRELQILKGRVLVLEATSVVLKDKFDKVQDCLGDLLIEKYEGKELVQ